MNDDKVDATVDEDKRGEAVQPDPDADANLETSDTVLHRSGQTRDSWQDRPRPSSDSPRPDYHRPGEADGGDAEAQAPEAPDDTTR